MKTIAQLKILYPYVVKWADWVRADEARTCQMLRRAEATFAPRMATYEIGSSGIWRTADRTTWPNLRAFLFESEACRSSIEK